MPVDTRRVTHAAGTQPASMGAGGQDLDPNENKPKNDQQEDKTPPKPMPGPRTPTPSAHAVAAELADVENELASARNTADELLSRAKARRSAQQNAKDKNSSTMPSPPPRPRIEDECTAREQDMKELGATIGDSIKAALTTTIKEDTGSFIAKEEAALVQCDLSLSSRKGFIAMLRNKGRLVDERVDKLFSLESGSDKEILYTIEQLGLKSVDKRLAATIFKCLKEKQPFVVKLTKAAETDPALGMSGVLMIKWINEETNKVMRNDPEEIKLAFDNEPFLQFDAAKEINEIKAMEMLSSIEALPTKYNGSQRDKLLLVFNKIPAQVKNEHWVATLEIEYRRAIRAGGAMPWSPEALCEEIIDNMYLKRSVVPKPSVHAGQRLSTAPSKTGDGGARASRLKGQVLTGTLRKWLGETGAFAFISMEGDKNDIFCHKNSVVGDKPKDGSEVQFKITFDIPDTGKRGGERREYATDVRLVTQPIANVAAAAQTETETEQPQGQIIYFNTD